MELKELILSTLEELDVKIQEDGYKEPVKTLSCVSKRVKQMSASISASINRGGAVSTQSAA
jgi:hypothetical protein